jgi:hypothetical protein
VQHLIDPGLDLLRAGHNAVGRGSRAVHGVSPAEDFLACSLTPALHQE